METTAFWGPAAFVCPSQQNILPGFCTGKARYGVCKMLLIVADHENVCRGLTSRSGFTGCSNCLPLASCVAPPRTPVTLACCPWSFTEPLLLLSFCGLILSLLLSKKALRSSHRLNHSCPSIRDESNGHLLLEASAVHSLPFAVRGQGWF